MTRMLRAGLIGVLGLIIAGTANAATVQSGTLHNFYTANGTGSTSATITGGSGRIHIYRVVADCGSPTALAAVSLIDGNGAPLYVTKVHDNQPFDPAMTIDTGHSVTIFATCPPATNLGLNVEADQF